MIRACTFVMVSCTNDALACLCLVASPSYGLGKYTACTGDLIVAVVAFGVTKMGTTG